MGVLGAFGKRRSAGNAGLATVASLGLLAAIVTAPGFPVSNVSLNDGSVWVTSTERGEVARLNRQIDRLDASLDTQSEAFDVLQSENTVIVTNPGAGTAKFVDVSMVEFSGEATLPIGAVAALGGDSLAVLDADGSGWVMRPDEVLSTQFDEEDPDVEVGRGARVAAGLDGTAHFLSVEKDVVVSVAPGGEPETIEISADVGEDASISAVGETAVVLDGSNIYLITDEAIGVAAGPVGDNAVLQEPGPQAAGVVVVGDDAMVTVPLTGDGATVLVDEGAGAPIAPVVVAGCAYAAWATTPTMARTCPGRDALVTAIPETYPGAPLRFRVNRNVVALNETRTGDAFVVTDSGEIERIDNWDDFVDEVEADETAKEKQKEKRQEKRSGERCTPRNLPPIAVDDAYGIRPGHPALLPVTANDRDPDTCDVVVVSAVDQPAVEVGRFDIVEAGKSLQFTPGRSPGASISTSYRLTDGRGGSDAARVTMKLRTDEENGVPKALRPSRTTTEAGKQVAYNVLVDWTDPDGDPLILVTASSDDAVIRWSPDGTITVVDPGTAAGSLRIPFRVTDGKDAVAGTLQVDVQPEGAPMPPVTAHDYAVTVVDEPVTVRPLDNDTDANGDALRLVSVGRAEGAQVDSDLSAATVTVTPARAGTFVITYEVSDGSGEGVRGTIRVDARPADRGQPPVAVLDKVQVDAGGAPVAVDVLRNDSDPDGDALGVTGVTVKPGSVVQASVIDFTELRISARRALDVPELVEYRITDGRAAARGFVIVTTSPPTEEADQPPISRPDRASVRAGDIVDIAVLDNDTDPESGPLLIDPTLVEEPAQGFMFVDGVRLRFRAPAEPGSVTAVYQVRDRAQNAASARVTITVVESARESNRPPVPSTLTARVMSGATADIPVPVTGVDPDGDSVFLDSIERTPRLGSVQLVPGSNVIRYSTPAEQTEGGADAFRYRVKDPLGLPGVGTVRVVVIPRAGNQDPVAVDDVVVVRPGRTVTVPVLGNDSDPDGDALRLAPPPQVTDGVTFGNDSITVEVAGGESSRNVTYRVEDGRGGRAAGLLTVSGREKAPGLPPVAKDDAPTDVAAEATAVTVDVLDNDHDPDGTNEDLVVAMVDTDGASVRGSMVTVELREQPRRVLYSVTDIDGNVAYAFVSVPGLIRAPELKPGAVIEAQIGDETVTRVDDVVFVPGGGSLRLTGDPVMRPSDGQARALDAQSFGVTPIESATNSSKVTVTVTTEGVPTVYRVDVPVRITGRENRPPTTSPATVNVARGDDAASLPLGRYATDPDPDDQLQFGDAVVAAGDIEAALEGGTLRVSASPEADLGSGRITYTVTDGESDPVTGTVAVTVTETQRRPPKAANVEETVNPGESVSIDVVALSYDPFEGQDKPLSVVAASAPQGRGSVTFDQTNVVFTPNATTGVVMVNYRIVDAAAREADGVVTVNVIGPPTTPGTPVVDTGSVVSRQVSLTWGAPANTGGAPIIEYVVESQPGSGSTTCPTTSCTVTGLANGTEYRFRVVASNAEGLVSDPSGWSAPVTPDVVPEPPTGVQVSSGDQSLTVSWRAARSAGTAVLGYQVMVNGEASVSATSTSAVLTGLVNGTEYLVSVVASNKKGPGPASDPVRGTPMTTPRAPTGLVGSDVGGDAGGRIRLTWSMPSDNGGSAITGVRVMPSANGCGTGQELPGAPTSTELAVEKSAGCSFTVAVLNEVGWSPASAVSNTVRSFAAPGAPTNVRADVTRNRTAVSWARPASDGGQTVSGYTVTASPGGGSCTTTGGLSCEMAGLNNGQSYTFTVRADNGKAGPSSGVSNTVTPYGDIPVQNTLLNTHSVGEKGFTARWGQVISGGRTITRVVVRVGDRVIHDGHNGGGEMPLGDLACGTSYPISLTAYDGGNPDGGAVKQITASTGACPPAMSVEVSKGPLLRDAKYYIIIAIRHGRANSLYGCQIWTSDGDRNGTWQRNVDTDSSGYGDNWSNIPEGTAWVWDGGGTVTVDCEGTRGTASW